MFKSQVRFLHCRVCTWSVPIYTLVVFSSLSQGWKYNDDRCDGRHHFNGTRRDADARVPVVEGG